MLDAKLLKPNVNGDSLPRPLIIGTFEKPAPGFLKFQNTGLPPIIVFIAQHAHLWGFLC